MSCSCAVSGYKHSMGFLCLGAFSALEAGEFEVVILKDGQRVTGEIVSDKPNALSYGSGL